MIDSLPRYLSFKTYYWSKAETKSTKTKIESAFHKVYSLNMVIKLISPPWCVIFTIPDEA